MEAPVHDVAPSTPFVDVGGQRADNRAQPRHDDCFVTADLERALILGPSSLVLKQGTRWFGGAQGKFFAVAEGVRGAETTPMTSAIAVREVCRHIAAVMPWAVDLDHDDERELHAQLTRAIARSQRAIRLEARRRGFDETQVAATMTIAYLVWPRLLLAHVGDSRAYLYRGGHLYRLTRDGTLGAQLKQRGVLSSEKAASPPYDRSLLGAVGGRSERLDLEFHHYQLEPGDQLLLCTHALARSLGELEIARQLDAGVVAQMACRRMVELASDAAEDESTIAVLARVEKAAKRSQLRPASSPTTHAADHAVDPASAAGQAAAGPPHELGSQRRAMVLTEEVDREASPERMVARAADETDQRQWSVLGESKDHRGRSEP